MLQIGQTSQALSVKKWRSNSLDCVGKLAVKNWVAEGAASEVNDFTVQDSHCAFSSNLFHGYIAQIYINQLSDPENKNVALEKFLERTTLKPLDFWAGEALEARRRDCLNIT